MRHDAPLLTGRMIEEIEAMEGQSRSRAKEALSLFETHVPQLVKTLRKAAQDLLLRELIDVSKKYFGSVWSKDLEFAAWRTILEGPDAMTEEEVNRLEELSDLAGGWFHYLGQPDEIAEGAEPDFVSLEDWEVEYAEKQKETRSKSPANLQAKIEELESKLQRREV